MRQSPCMQVRQHHQHIYRPWDTPELHFITFCGFSVSFPMFLACLSVPIDIGVLFTYLSSLFFAGYSHKTINLSLSLSLSIYIYIYINSFKTDTHLQYCEVDNLTSNIYIYIYISSLFLVYCKKERR